MPHKHTRKQTKDGDFNLAPTQQAKPLAAFAETSAKGKNKGKDVVKTKANKDGKANKGAKSNSSTAYKGDDTPRAFARLMQMQSEKRPLSGLDNGEDRRAKKIKVRAAADADRRATQAAAAQKTETPKILPGERMADFAARVNQALPVSGLARKGKSTVDGMKERQTKKEKQMHKMYAEWRVEDARRKEKLEEEAELAEEAEADQEADYGGQSIKLPEGRKKQRRKEIGEVGDDEDPWAVLRSRREKPKGLHDVAQAPPEFKAIPKEKFKVRDGAKVNVANVPTSAGSLKKREELGEARQEVIERYRAMMKAGRSG